MSGNSKIWMHGTLKRYALLLNTVYYYCGIVLMLVIKCISCLDLQERYVWKVFNFICFLSACYNKQACSPPPWDTQSFAGYYPSSVRSWKGAFLSQRAGPADSATLHLLSSGQRGRQFRSVWLGPSGLSQTRGEDAIKNRSDSWGQNRSHIKVFFTQNWKNNSQ